MQTPTQPITIIRTERGLTISGTRITLYDVMDYLKADYPIQLIREKLGLNEQQIQVALTYIKKYHSEVELDYQECLRIATENRQYWEKRNQEKLAEIATKPPQSNQATLRTKLQEWKAQLEA